MGKLMDIIMQFAEQACEARRESVLRMYDVNVSSTESDQKTDR